MQRVTETVVARKPRGGNDVNASLVTALKAPRRRRVRRCQSTLQRLSAVLCSAA